MGFHIVLPRPSQLAAQADKAARGESPRHALWMLAKALNASIHEPEEQDGKRLTDKLWSKVFPTEQLWALARKVHLAARPSDVILCSSEAAGFHLASQYSSFQRRPRVAVFVHNVDRPRARLALKLWELDKRIDLFLAVSAVQADFLRSFLGVSDDRVRHIWDHTDTGFFSPGPAGEKKRPMILSVGLEQRDYKTLAAATHDLDLDVKISGFSKDAAAMARSFPQELPQNMSRRFYEWVELRQLYRDTDAVVVSCHENKYAAGVQSLMESMACKRPLIVTATSGLREYLTEAALKVCPGNQPELRRAILQIIEDRPAAESRALLGWQLATRQFSIDRYVSDLRTALISLS